MNHAKLQKLVVPVLKERYSRLDDVSSGSTSDDAYEEGYLGGLGWWSSEGFRMNIENRYPQFIGDYELGFKDGQGDVIFYDK